MKRRVKPTRYSHRLDYLISRTEKVPLSLLLIRRREFIYPIIVHLN